MITEAEKVPWHKNGVWIPWAVMTVVGAFLAQVAWLFYWGGRVQTQVDNTAQGLSAASLRISDEHTSIRSEIRSLSDRLDTVNNAQARDDEHQKFQDQRLQNIEDTLKKR